MKRKSINIFITILFITTVLFLIFILVDRSMYKKSLNTIYETDYPSKFEISNLKKYDEIKQIKSNEILSEETDENGHVIMKFNGYSFVFGENDNLIKIDVTSPEFRFGKNLTGVGSTLKEIRRAYREKLVFGDRKREFGFVDSVKIDNTNGFNLFYQYDDGGPYFPELKPVVFYKFDSNLKVIEITIYLEGIF